MEIPHKFWHDRDGLKNRMDYRIVSVKVGRYTRRSFVDRDGKVIVTAWCLDNV